MQPASTHRQPNHLTPSCLLAMLLTLTACATIDTAAIRHHLRQHPAPPILLTAIGPTRWASGEQAPIVAPASVNGVNIGQFVLTDGYFKLAFTIVEELRNLGFSADVAPSLWYARAKARQLACAQLFGLHLQGALTQAGLGEKLALLASLPIHERQQVLAAEQVLLTARSAWPLRLYVKAGNGKLAPPDAGTIRARYFTPNDNPPHRLTLSVLVEELSCTLAGLSPGGEQLATATLHFDYIDRDTAKKRIYHVRTTTTLPNSGLHFDAEARSYSLQRKDGDALDEVIRQAVREFAAQMLEDLP